MKRKRRFPMRRVVRDLILATGAAAALVLAYVLGTFDGERVARDVRAAPPPQQAVVQSDPPSFAKATEGLPSVARSAKEGPAWQRHAVRIAHEPGRPMIALVIDDMGLDRKRSARAAALPARLTLAYLPYAAELPMQTAAARDAGHELLVHVPMEPDSAAEDPGPHAMLASAGEREILAELDWMLGRFDFYVGINNHMGSRFTRDPARMAMVLSELKRRGLLFLDSRTTARTVAADTARTLGVPVAERDIFLDAEDSTQAVRARLADLEARAKAQGYAVAIGHPKDATLAALEQWIPQARARGFALVPLTAVVTAQPPRHASR